MTGLDSGVAEREMIKVVDELLWQWAEWVDRRESNGLGYQMSSLNIQMASTCSASGSPVGIDGRLEEFMSLVDVVLCQDVDAENKRLLDRYYRGHVGGDIAVKQMVEAKRRKGAKSSNLADEFGVTRQTIHAWIHNAQVEFQQALASRKRGIRQVGVMGVVVGQAHRTVAANFQHA